MVPFFKFFTVLGVIKAEILFSMMKGDVFVNGSFSFDSIMMNLGCGSSLSESHSIWGLFAWVFVLKVLDEFIEHAPHPPWSPIWGCAWGKPIRLATPGLHGQYTHAGDRQINFLSLGFRSQDNYFPRDRKDYESFLSMIDPTAIVLI